MKNPDIKNLRVVVISADADNHIDQSSSVDEILACEELQLVPITDYFQAQNDEEYGSHWSFLIDISDNAEWTGANLNEVHQFDKKSKIAEIKQILTKWGETTACELELDSSPCLNSIGNGRNNVSQLVEHFNHNSVKAITYSGEDEIDEEYIEYEDLPEEIIDEIYDIICDYDAEQEKTNDRCKSENY